MNPGPRIGGFTLIEILVVLLIVTIMAGVTVARLPGYSRNADFNTETRRLELLFSMARQEAMLDSIEFGFSTTATGYKFMRFDDGSQRWIDADSPFQERPLPTGLKLSISSDDKNLKLLGENLPPVLILSSGENTPFRLTLESGPDGLSDTLASDGYGEFEWQSGQ